MPIKLNKNITDELQNNRFCLVSGQDWILEGNFQDFYNLLKSWEYMGKDAYFGNKDNATRYRRYSDFSYNPISYDLKQLNHKSYYQSREHNMYVGGKERDFEVYAKTLPEEFRNKIWQCQIAIKSNLDIFISTLIATGVGVWLKKKI